MSNDATAGHRIVGTLHTEDGKGVVRMRDRFGTTVDDLWSAFIDPERLARWLGDFDGDLRLGGEFKARFFSSGWEGRGRVTECEPPRRLVVVTTGTGAMDEHVIEAVLTPDGDATVLELEERGMPVNMLPGYGAGIQTHVEDLAAHVAGRGRCDADARFEQLYPAYQALAAELG